jgi:hypothetical protein
VTEFIVLAAVVGLLAFVLYWSGRYGDRNRSKGTSLRRGPSAHTTTTGQAKRAYATRHDADLAAQAQSKRGAVLSAYRCSTCGEWHLGH